MQRRRSCRRFWWSLGMNEKEQIVPIRSLIEGCWPGEWGTDPSGDDGNCVVFRATDIDSDGHLNFEGGASRHVLPTKLKAKSLKRGDIILEASGGAPDKPVGRVALVDQHPRQPSLTSNFFRFMRPVESIDARFLSFQLVALNKSSAIWRYQQQTTGLINLKVDDYLDHKVWCPSKVHQQKIADILTRINDTIEKTEALIEKYQQIKAGLMHDLFTRGVLPDGKLRPTREQAPELYRETGIGWIPKEWTVRRNADLCQRICVGIVIQPTQYYVEDGIPAFRSANIREHGIDKSNFVFISSAANNLLIKSQVRAGDIISVRTGYPGTSAVVPLEFDGANCIDILIATPGGEVSSDYLCAWINSSFGKGQVFRQQGGMAQQHFNVGEMKELMVAFPDVDEQVRIEKILNNFSAKLKKESDFLNKIHFQKKGLMHDLLTGKVAVKVDEAQEEHV